MTRRRRAHRPVITSQADLARRRGCARSTVSRQCRPGGALFPAMVTPDRVDLSHPATQAFLAAGAPREAEPEGIELVVTETALTPAEVAARTRIPLATVLADMQGPLAPAVVVPWHLALEVFAWYAGTSVDVVLAAVDAELEQAVTPTGRIDLSSPAALGYLAVRPFKRKRNGDPSDCPEGFLAPACVGDDLDVNSPFFRAWCARLDSRVPTDADIERMFAGAAVA